jgi:Domain of unknown function (DUF1707)
MTEHVSPYRNKAASLYLIGDAQRQAVADYLNIAFSEGFLTAGELDARVSEALAGRDVTSMASALDKLPDVIVTAGPEPVPEPAAESAEPKFTVPRAPVGVRLLRIPWVMALGAEIVMLCIHGTRTTDAFQFLILCTLVFLGVINTLLFADWGY